MIRKIYYEFPNTLNTNLDNNKLSINVLLKKEHLSQFIISLMLLKDMYIEKVTINDISMYKKLILKRKLNVQEEKRKNKKIPIVGISDIIYDKNFSCFELHVINNDLENTIAWFLHGIVEDIVGYNNMCLEQEYSNSEWVYWGVNI
jgi:hypothetical protein